MPRTPRCEPLEGRVLPAASLNYPRFAAALQAAWEGPPPLAQLAAPPRRVEADFDGDGLIDRVELSRPAGATTDTLDAYRGRDDGSLELVRTTALGFAALSLVGEDFDLDGRPDLFALGEVPLTGTLLLNEGAWQFAVCQRTPPRVAVAAADLTGDGADDFVFANHSLDRVSVAVSGGGPALLADGPAGALAPDAVTLADLDGDGRLDLLVSTAAGGVLVYPGLGGGQFGPDISDELGLPFVGGPVRVSVALLRDQEIRNDHFGVEYDPYLDLLVADVGRGTVSVFLGEGGWKMRPAGEFTAGLAPSAVAPGDVNGDGMPDLVVTAAGEDAVWILPGLGGGRFDDKSPRILPVGRFPLASFLADFDGDRRLDLAVVNAGSDDLTIYSDVGSPSTVGRSVATGGRVPAAALARDVDRDGYEDLVVAHREDGAVSWLAGGAAGLSLREVVQSQSGRPTALADSGQAWKVYVAGEEGERAEVVSFTPLFEALPTAENGDAPSLEPPAEPAEARLEPLSPGAVGVVPTLLRPLFDRDEPAEERIEAEEAGTAVRAKPAAANLSGGGEEAAEVAEEPVEPVEPPTDPAVQRFLLGAGEPAAPPPLIDGGEEMTVRDEPAWLAQPLVAMPDTCDPIPSEEEPPPVRDDETPIDAVLLLAALALLGNRPATGRPGGGAAR